jgi:O-antigen ligase
VTASGVRGYGRALALAVSIAALSAALWLLSRPAPAPPPLPWAPEWLRVGVNVDLAGDDAAALSATLSRLAQLGLTTVRQRFDWNLIEPAAGQFTWDTYDRIVAAANANGIGLLAVLDGSPAWARDAVDSANSLAPPREWADFGRFAARLAARYAGKIHVYQVWDEPNIAPHWGARWVDPSAYAGLLREGYVQLKAADPDSMVLTASLAPTLETGGANLSDIAFLEQMLAAGASGWFDAAAIAPYGFDQAPAAAPAPDRLNYRRAELLHRVLLRHGLPDRPLWAVACGWYALPAGAADAAAPWPTVSEEQQAAYAAEALTLAQRWPWLQGWLWAGYQPRLAADARWGFALRQPDGTERPVLATLAQTAAAPNDVLSPGRHRPTAPALHYTGGWRATPLAADLSRSTDDTLTFRFVGRRLDLDVQRGAYWAYLVISVDGQPANALPRQENGEAILVLYDPLAARAAVTVADHLTPGEHQVEVRSVGGWGQWPLVALTVYDDLPTAGIWRASGWLLLLGSLLAGVSAWFWPRLRFWRQRQTPPRLRAVAVSAFLARALRLTLFLTAATLPFFQRLIPFAGRAFAAPEVLTWLGLALWLGLRFLARRAHAPPRLPRRGFSLDLPVAAFLAVALLSTLRAANFEVASREFRTVFLDAALFYFLISRLLANESPRSRSFWLLLDGLALGAAAVALVGLGQAILGADIIHAEGVGRVRAFYGSPNNLALYLERVLPLLLTVAAFGIGRRRWLYGGLAALVLPCLILTFSRGAIILGLPTALLFIGLLRRGKALRLTAAALGVGALGLIAVLQTGAARFAGLLDFQAGTSFVRLKLWRGAWNMALDFPWLGVGPDNFLYAYRTRYVLPSAWEELNLSHPHNILLDFWTRLGLVGVAAGAWLLISVARTGWRVYQALPDGHERAAILGLLAGLVAGLAHGLVDNSLFLMDLSYFFFLCAGVFGSLSQAAAPLTAHRGSDHESL